MTSRGRTIGRAVLVAVALIAVIAFTWPTLRHMLRAEAAARLFPDAVEVRLFAWQYKGTEIVQLVPEGVALAPNEVAALRQSVFWVAPPSAIAGCCIPRHEFKFYDRHGKVLGKLEVCFECICAHLEGEAPARPELSWVDWDVGPIEAIVRAHNLPIAFE